MTQPFMCSTNVLNDYCTLIRVVILKYKSHHITHLSKTIKFLQDKTSNTLMGLKPFHDLVPVCFSSLVLCHYVQC